MVSCEQLDIAREYNILLEELKRYNPELLDKKRILAVTKCDMLDEDMMEQLKHSLPTSLPTILISAVSGLNMQRLKDMIVDAIDND